MRGPLFLLGICAAMAMEAQGLTRRHERISSEYEAEHYAEVVRLIDLQLKEAAGTSWQDSAHLYLYKYGRACRKLKGADAGVAAAERIYALVKERGRPRNELEALFDLSWTYYDVGRVKECVRVDSTAVRVADGSSEISPSQRGRARQYVAFDYSVLGDHRNSAKYALQALDEYGKADSVAPAQWAESYTAVGAAYWHLGLIQKAESYYKKALEVLGSGTSEEVLARKVSAYGNLGVMWQSAGDYARSKNYYHESLRNSGQVIAGTKDPFTRDEAVVARSKTYLNLATVHHQCGDEARARELLEMAWADRSGVLEADDPQLLAIQERFADIELSVGDLDKAQELEGAYLAACEGKFGKRSEEYIRACSKLGEIALREKDWAKADSLFAVSIAAGRLNADASTDMVLAATLQSRAQLKEETGHASDAMADLLHARRILVRVNGPQHYAVANCDVLLARAAFLQDDPKVAIAYADSALGMLQDRVRALNATNVPQMFNDPQLLPDAIYWKVRAERELAGPGMAKSQWNNELDLAIRSLARNKTAMHDDASKLLLISAQKDLFGLALDLAYEAYAVSRSATDMERFINISEADRSILLKNRLNGFAGLRFAGVPDTVITREQELCAALDLDPKDRTAATDMNKREKAYADFLKDLEREYPAYFDLRYGEPHITLADIRKHLLTPDRQLLAYATSDRYLYSWVVSMDSASIVRSQAAGIGEAVRTLNTAIMSRTVEPYANAAFRLYQRVFAPVERLLTRPELFIVPDGALHALNFEALLMRPGTKGFRDHLLIQRHTIAYLLSATTAVQFANMARRPSKGVLAIAPGFTDELKQDYLTSVNDTSQVDRDFLHLVRQPFAERTAKGLGNTLSAKVMTGKAANERAFREQVPRFGILHLGTHAEMNATAPMYSRLVLSKDGHEMEPDDDGYLHVYELYELDLHAQLAVLTACATGRGRDDAGEGVRSLGYGFAYAGCPSLMVSLWNIDEKVSAEITAHFYENLADGMPKHEALRQAKLDHLAHASDELGLPYYWAGMVLEGDVAPVALGGAQWPHWPWALLAGLFIGASWWWVRGRIRNRGTSGPRGE
jgi:CHAT domain-containing protein